MATSRAVHRRQRRRQILEGGQTEADRSCGCCRDRPNPTAILHRPQSSPDPAAATRECLPPQSRADRRASCQTNQSFVCKPSLQRPGRPGRDRSARPLERPAQQKHPQQVDQVGVGCGEWRYLREDFRMSAQPRSRRSCRRCAPSSLPEPAAPRGRLHCQQIVSRCEYVSILKAPHR